MNLLRYAVQNPTKKFLKGEPLMARKVGAEAIYEVAQSFRDRCIKSDQSLLWPENRPWTAESMRRLWIAFKDNPDVSEQTFYQKWKGQLANEAKDVHMIAADLVAFYYLFPQDIKKGTKLERLKTVIGWKLSSEQPNLASVERAFDSSIGTTGRVYLNRIPDQIAFFLAFAEAVHACLQYDSRKDSWRPSRAF